MDQTDDTNWGLNKQNQALLRSQFPLHSAIRDGDMETTISLLNSGRFDLYEEDGFYGWTPVHWAAHFGKLDCLTELLRHGASCDVATHRFNQSPAHIAALSSKLHCLKWLLHWGASLNRQDFMGETPLHKAARSGSMECVSLLISQGCALGLRNHNGDTASQVAAVNGFHECATQLQKSQQFQEQSMAANVVTTYNCNNNNNQAPADPAADRNEKSDPCCSGDVHQNSDTLHLNGEVDMGCDMDTGTDELMHKPHVKGIHMTNGFSMPSQNGHIANGFHMPSQNGFGGTKRGRDESEEETFKRQRCDERSSHSDEATSANNTILSSYNAVLAISATPSSPSLPSSQSSDILHAEARVIPPCSMDQDHPYPNTPLSASGLTSCTVASPNRDIPVKCLTLHSHMI